jgi:hypothetical protein
VSAKRLRIAAFLLLANYVLALTVGGGFHVHGDHPCAADSAHSTSRCAYDAAEPPGGPASEQAGGCASEDPAGEEMGLVSSGSEKCPVCQFLAQNPVPVRSVEAGASTELVDGWVPAHPVRPVDHVPSTHPIRGPPAVA